MLVKSNMKRVYLHFLETLRISGLEFRVNMR